MSHPQLTPEHRRLVIKEALMGAVISGGGPTVIIHLLGAPPPSSVWGQGGVGPATLMATFFCVMLMSLILTGVTRRRVARGAVPSLAAGDTWLRYAPRRALPRAALLTLAMLLVAPAATISVVLGLGLLPMSGPAFLGFNILFGGLLGLTAAPLVVIAALADPVPVARPALAR
jgi:hypothetical protein